MSDLINTLESPGEFDALTKLRPEEPYFPLVGRDRLAPPLVQQWADANRERALREFSDGIINKEKRDRELRKSTDAEAIGWAMRAFKAGDMQKRVKEEPTAKTYTGAEVPEETKLADKMHTLRTETRNALNNAIAEAGELLKFLRSFEGPLPSELEPVDRKLASAIVDMETLAELVGPRRHIERAA